MGRVVIITVANPRGVHVRVATAMTPAELAAALQQHGWFVVPDVGTADAADRVLDEVARLSNAKRRVADWLDSTTAPADQKRLEWRRNPARHRLSWHAGSHDRFHGPWHIHDPHPMPIVADAFMAIEPCDSVIEVVSGPPGWAEQYATGHHYPPHKIDRLLELPRDVVVTTIPLVVGQLIVYSRSVPHRLIGPQPPIVYTRFVADAVP